MPDLKGSSLEILIEADMYDLKEYGKTPAFEVQLEQALFHPSLPGAPISPAAREKLKNGKMTDKELRQNWL